MVRRLVAYKSKGRWGAIRTDFSMMGTDAAVNYSIADRESFYHMLYLTAIEGSPSFKHKACINIGEEE